VKIKIVVLDRPPQSLNENIVLDAASAVHADFYVMMFQKVCKCFAGELSSLIRIKNIRRAEPIDGVFKCLNAEISIKGVR
jgi:hypothetical protein